MKGIACAVIGLFVALSAFSDTRIEAMDFYILYDRSLSMAEEGKSEDSKNWLISAFIGPVVIPGDYVFLLSFYGKTETIWDGPVADTTQKQELMRRIQALKPDGRWTDIGGALDALKARLESSINNGRKKYIIIVSDEIAEPPPESRYFSKDGSFSHAYLTYVRRERHGAWKVITLGVGLDQKVESGVRELSSVLSALPPERLAGTDPRLIGPDAGEGPEDGAATQGGPGDARSVADARDGTDALSAGQARVGAGGKAPWLIPAVLGALGLGLLIVLTILVFRALRSKRADEDEKKEEKVEDADPRRT